MKDKSFLHWLADRLVNKYKESPNIDFVLKLKAIALGTSETRDTDFVESSTQAKVKFKLPDFTQSTPAFFADELGDTRDQIKQLQKYEGVLKEALSARRDPKNKSVVGERHTAVFSNRSRTGLDTAAITTEMGADWVAAHSKTTNYVEIRTSAED